MRHALTLSLSLAFWLVPASWAQEVKPRPDQPPAAAALLPNSEPTYQALRKLGLSGETVSVANFTLKRDAGAFTFRSGTFHVLAPIEGKVTGAVFLGDGSFTLVPPIASEGRVLALLTKEAKLEETFDQVVLRFTDGTYDELKKQPGGTAGAGGSNAASVLNDINNTLREKLNFNLASRILQDVISPRPGGLFVAFIRGKKYSDKMMYILDPQGVPNISPDMMPDWQVAPEEIALTTYEDNKNGVWAAFHLSHEYASGQATGTQKNYVIDIENQQLETSIEKSGKLSGKATTTFVANRDGLSVVPFDLYRTLRVQSVTDAAGTPLHFIQEDKNDDPDFAVVLPKPLAAGERYTITTTYAGKEVVLNEGNGNYYPVARSSWYPNSHLGDYATYEMTFRVPKGLKMVATGILVSEIVEGDESISRWRTEIAQSVAGFNFGKFKREEFKMEQLGYLVESYANKEPPDVVRHIQLLADDSLIPSSVPHRPADVALGSMDTSLLVKKALAEAQLSMMLFTDYFGPASYKHLAVTQQTAFNYGQAWPGVVWLPISYFFDTTVRHQLGMDDPRGYFKTVGPHEVAHQWWGHTVGTHSYRDEWIAEGFAEMAASLYIQMIQKKPQEFIKFWEDQLWLLTQKNKEGFRAIDAGPVTLGYRLATTKSGFDIPRRLIYPKGGYILHMVRMMMWSPQTGDDTFKNMLKDFVRTYANRAATTEDFKKMVEKYMTPEMNVRGDGKMDWFFDEYVYGTSFPTYRFEHSFSDSPEGPVLNLKVRQSNVHDRFNMIVPLYLELASGKVFRLGSTAMAGNTTFEQKIPLRGLSEKPKRAMLNYFNDVLCTMEK